MFYNNLIYLLIIILIFSTSGVPDAPQLPFVHAFPLFILKAVLYVAYVKRAYFAGRIHAAAEYFRAEQKSSILAIILTAMDVYLLDCKYYFAMTPLARDLPVLTSVLGILLFFLYLSINWAGAAKSYALAFGRYYGAKRFALHNLKMNLPIVLPWFVLSLVADSLRRFDIPALRKFLDSPWGEPALLLLFFALLAVVFPAIITNLWNCRPLPPGDIRHRIEEFCRDQKLRYADILMWPLFEGQVITAGVMGFVQPFRYLLITPALLRAMTSEEVEAVMAHEIGHVKRYHLQLYFLLFLGFGAIVQLSAYPFFYLLLNWSFFYEVAHIFDKGPSALMAILGTAPLLLILILYFRYIFGFFMRNFERQADAYVFKAIGSSEPLVRVLDKIAYLSGNIRDVPSWHHFGIGQRIDFLEKCEKDRSVIAKHDRKVYAALAAYLFFLVVAIIGIWRMPADVFERGPLEQYEALLEQKIEAEPKNPLWHQLHGDLLYSRNFHHKAIAAYEMSLTLEPENADVLNNLAWLFLTVEVDPIHNPERALLLARKAAALKPSGYILDTLANAYWQNGLVELALETEKRAVEVDPENRKYYMDQLHKFAAPATVIIPEK